MRILSSTLIALTLTLTAPVVASAGTGETTGIFTGASEHITTGGVTVVKNADGSATVTLADDFSLMVRPIHALGSAKTASMSMALMSACSKTSRAVKALQFPPPSTLTTSTRFISGV